MIKLFYIRCYTFVFTASLFFSGCSQNTTPSTIIPEAVNSACQITGPFPLRTHYKTGLGPTLGGLDTPSMLNLMADQQVQVGQPFVLKYSNFVPDLDHYIGDRYDIVTYSDSDVRGVLGKLCSDVNSKVRFVQPDIEISTIENLNSLLEQDIAEFQVLHGLVFRNNLFTIIIPPLWNKTKSYPSLINGFYSLNQNFIKQVGPKVLTILDRTYAQDKKGAVGLLWNGGGALASRTTNNKAYQDFNDFMKIVVPVLNLDRDKAIAYGASRGGSTAINLASHPLVDQLRFAFVYAHVPPSEFDVIANLISPTVPELLSANDWTTGYVGSWSDDFKMQDGTTSGKSQHLKVLTGSLDPVYLQANINLTAPGKITKLIQNNTSVLIEIGTFDTIVPSVDQFKLFSVYSRNNVRVEARINYLSGHNGFQSFEYDLYNALLKLNQSTVPRTETFVTKGKRQNFKVIAGKADSEPWDLSYATAALTIEFPKVIINNSPAHILATGLVGKSYAVLFRLPTGVLVEQHFTLDSDGIAILVLNRNAIPQGITKVEGIYEVDPSLQLVNKINYMSNLKNNAAIEIIRNIGTGASDPKLFGTAIADYFLDNIHGINCVNCYVPDQSMSYGILETGRQAPTDVERTQFAQAIH